MEVPSHISSKDAHLDCQAQKCDDLSSSSSTMISFELSNGRLYSPLVPTDLDDDHFVEFQLDDFTGCPSSAKKEQKMFTEAVIDSLKDREIRIPEVEQPPVRSAISTMSIEPSDKNDSHASNSHEISKPVETESSLLNHSDKTISTSSDALEPLKTESNSISVIPSPVTSLSSSKIPSSPLPPLDTSSVTESGDTESASTGNDSSASLQSSSDTDISHNTKATLTVIKNPTGHVLNGLLRRWDFKFFRNSQNR